MKKITLFLSLILTIQTTFSQETSRDWTSIVQTIEISTQKEKKFKLTGSVKVNTTDKNAWAGLWARVDNKTSEPGFFDNMADRPIKKNEWQEYTLEGTFNKHAKRLNFGVLCLFNGDFYFDNLKLFIENNDGGFEQVQIANNDFENKIANSKVPYWIEGILSTKPVRIKEYTLQSSNSSVSGSKSLLIKGKGIQPPKYEWGKIGKTDAKNPEIENMISMLEDLKGRVERAVKNLSPEHTDHLHDEKANRIGALIMHLAAAETYYHKYTFEKDLVEKKDEELWMAGMDLDTKGRELLKGKPISFYLKIFDEVREKTIAELRKRDDEWFKSTNAGKSMTNQYAWFHVMEHQSSHLGQILFLKKRLPPKEQKIELKEKIKN